MDIIQITSLFGLAFMGSAINSVAGGGTFLTFPALMFFGQTAISANVISTIALWPGTVASAYAYRKQWLPYARAAWRLVMVSFIGSGIGAYLLLSMPEYSFRAQVPWLLLIATLLFTFGRRIIAALRRKPVDAEAALQTPNKLHIALQSLIALYGGYFGAGIGILMLAALQIAGMQDIHRMNGIKTLLGTAINMVAFVIFVAFAIVDWNIAGIMIAGGITGGYFGAALAQRFHPEHVRKLVIVIAWSMTAYFFLK